MGLIRRMAPANNTMPSTPDKEIAHKVEVVGSPSPTVAMTALVVVLYVLSGCSQPILMTLLRYSGLADPSCQLYMLFYYLGTASAVFLLLRDRVPWPSKTVVAKACAIALWDITAQTLNYTGASLAGPTIFAIIYSSVSIWAAFYSQIFLGRPMDRWQWMSVIVVFFGLTVTATESFELGPDVLRGLFLVVVGSSMHGLFYVMSEAVMTKGEEQLSVTQNCAVQGLTASGVFLLWQFIYTMPRMDQKIRQPMELAGTTVVGSLGLLGLFGLISFVHSITFYHTLRYLPGGSTSAGVFKGLQAVLVFGFTHFLYCGRGFGGEEMCFSRSKLTSLIAVSGGVLWYAYATNENAKNGSLGKAGGYERIETDESSIEKA